MKRLPALLSIGLVAVAACSQSEPSSFRLPTTPTPNPPPTPVPQGPSLSGIVFENTAEGRRPVASVSVNARSEEAPCGFFGRNVMTDTEGRFVIRDVCAGVMVSLWAAKQRYLQPCAATVIVNEDSVRDIEIVSEGGVESNSAQLATVTPSILTGTVFEQTADGRQPAAGVIVGAEYNMDFVNASTRSDSAGRYLLCGLPPRVVPFYLARPGTGSSYQRVGSIDFRLPENQQRVVRDIQIGVPW